MFSIEYEDWKSICFQIFQHKAGRQKMYLQWYPFSGLSSKEKEMIMSKAFFEKFIKTGYFLYHSESWIIINNYIMRSDGNFRRAFLISPLMYLLILCIGKIISQKFISERPRNINIFYAGNYNEDRLYYKKDYDEFFKCLNTYSQSYRFFIKTDVKDFFSNIDMNELFEIVNNRLEKYGNNISQKDIILYKEMLLCMGQGGFPLIENSTVSSYLATVVYLENVDINLYNYIKTKEGEISDFLMIRYVDDLYILFNTETSKKTTTPTVNRILNCYSSELKKVNLSLNREKTSFKPITELNKELKKSLYDEIMDGKEFDVTNLFDPKNLINFLLELKKELFEHRLDILSYSKLIELYFGLPDIEYTAQEVYNSLIYKDHRLFSDKIIIDVLYSMISFDYTFLKFDTKRLIIMLLKTKDSRLIKQFLSKLFEAHKNKKWNIYDTSLAINYLIQRGFKHFDLIAVLKQEDIGIYNYYKNFCKESFLSVIKAYSKSYISNFIDKGFYNQDDKLFFFYFMYMIETKKKNHLTAFAYYKNFFDRISAHFGWAINRDKNKKGKPNYKNYYKEPSLKSLYNKIIDSEEIISKAHLIRNSSPLSHSSADLIDNKNTHQDILTSIRDLELLIKNKIQELN